MKLSRLLPLIGILIFIYLLTTIDIGKAVSLILAASPVFLLIAVLITLFDVLVKAYKWKLIFNSYNISVPYIRFLKSWLIGLSFSLVTPGKIGDFVKAFYLKDKAPLGKGLTTVMADRIIDLLTLFILAVIGLSIFSIFYAQSSILLISTIALFALFILAIVLFARKKTATYILHPFYLRLLPERYKSRVQSVFSDFYSGISLILGRKKTIAAVIALTFIVWLGSILSIYYMALSLGIEIPLSFLIIVFPAITLLEALPISFSGLGTRDATLIFFFGYLSLSPEIAVSTSFLYLLVSYIFGLLGLVFWWKDPIKFHSEEKKNLSS